MKKSWRTTSVGILGAIAIIATQAFNLLDNDPSTVFSIEALFAAIAVFGIGAVARDDKVTSEQAGAK